MNRFVIRPIGEDEVETSARIIREGFASVARDFNLTRQNCPTNGAFIDAQRLVGDLAKGQRMYGLYCGDSQVGFVQLEQKDESRIDMKRLTVLPGYRHQGGGKRLVEFACREVRRMGGKLITIGIIEENECLKRWYRKNGFIHTGTRIFKHLPFTVGFMQKDID